MTFHAKPTMDVLGPRNLELGPFAIEDAAQEAGPYVHWRMRTDEDGIVWLLFDKKDASANTLDAALLAELDAILEKLERDKPRGLVIRSAKRSGFIAGADIAQFRSVTDIAEIEALIRRGHGVFDQTADTKLTAFTDGCSGLRSILVDAGVTAPPGLDWFHIAMRLQHAEQVAGSLSADTPEREHAKAVIVAEVDRLHWRIWNGKAKDAQITLERIRQVMPVFQGDGDRKRDPPSRRLWTALREIDRYLTSQSAWLVNYAERHRAGLRVGTSLTEGTANFLVNRRMNKSQQMRWSRRGADLLLQVRCAGFNGKLGSGFEPLFDAEVNPIADLARAA